MTRSLLFVAALGLLVGWILWRLQSGPPAFASLPGPTRSVVYKTTPQGELRLFLHEPAERGIGPAPAVLFFHGGGWLNGTATQFDGQAGRLADRGIVGIQAEYRLADPHGATPFASLADAITAMRYVRRHAAGLGVDPGRVAAGGGSAGGHLAAALATATAEDLDTDPPADRGVSYRPDALILFNPVYDNGPGGYGHERIGDRYTDFSPLHNLHAGMPPTLVMLGDRDDLVPVATAERFRDGMRGLGVRSELIVYPGETHGFFNPHRGRRVMYERTLAATEAFLASLGWIGPPPGSR
ncbi:alpha/beta hydrolase [Phycisphaera mikurensis]|nr:alpha/beta hydrolase fold domain-containing protein [Phycisphaera mikurensis]MBB6441918.1 acetyl esterase/lipase [Phycisphaera mikurensis]